VPESRDSRGAQNRPQGRTGARCTPALATAPGLDRGRRLTWRGLTDGVRRGLDPAGGASGADIRGGRQYGEMARPASGGLIATKADDPLDYYAGAVA
jgi:hypothetical protein